MKARRLKVLMIEDNSDDAARIERLLADWGSTPFELRCANRLAAGLDYLCADDFDVVLLDLGLLDSQGLDTFRQLRARAPAIPIVILSGLDDELLAVQAVHEGAQDYLVKGEIDGHLLGRSLRHAIERQREAEALRESEQRYRRLLGSVTDYVYTVQIHDGQAVATSHGDGCATVTGFTPQEFAANPHLWYRMIHEEDRRAVLAQADRVLAGESVPPLEHRIIHKDGSIRWIRNSSITHRDEQGRLISYDGLIADITEFKLAQRRLLTEHAVTQVLAEAVTLADAIIGILRVICEGLGWDVGEFWSMDRQSGLLRCSASWHGPEVRILQFEASTRAHTFAPGVGLPGRVWTSGRAAWVPDVARDTNLPRAPIAVQEGLHGAFAFPISLGREILGVAEFFSRDVREPDHDLLDMLGNIGSQVGQFMERKQTDEALQTQAALLQSIVDSMGAGLVVCDEHGRFMLFTEAARQMVGLGPTERPFEEWVEHYGIYLPDAVTPHPTAALPMALALRGMAVSTAELFVRNPHRPDGVWLSVNTRPLKDAAGTVKGGVAVISDVSERKQLERQRAQMLAAQEVQSRLFPTLVPELPGFDIGGASCPAELTTGDYFDFIPLPDGSLGIVVGDVAGHGLSAALLMVEVRTCLRTLAETEADIGQILTRANRILCNDAMLGRFVTLFFGKLDPRTRSFVWAGAGHRAYLFRPSGDVEVLGSTCPPLGTASDMIVPTARAIEFQPGQLMLLLTDGIPEAKAPDGSQFGTLRVFQTVHLYRNDPARQLVDNLYHTVRSFSHCNPQDDDITVVVLK